MREGKGYIACFIARVVEGHEIPVKRCALWVRAGQMAMRCARFIDNRLFYDTMKPRKNRILFGSHLVKSRRLWRPAESKRSR